MREGGAEGALRESHAERLERARLQIDTARLRPIDPIRQDQEDAGGHGDERRWKA